MKFRTIVGLLIVLIVCSCSQRVSKGELQVQDRSNQHLGAKSGLLFDKGGKRGTEYTDSMGTNYNLRYSPITITNDSTIPIHLQLAFSKEYDFPIAYGDGKFNVIPLPKEWAIDGMEISDSMFDKLRDYINRPLLNETIEPGEIIVVAVGILLSRPPKISINLNAPFAHTDGGIFTACDWLMKEDPSSNSEITLGLKLDINEICTIIPCGKISYLEH